MDPLGIVLLAAVGLGFGPAVGRFLLGSAYNAATKGAEDRKIRKELAENMKASNPSYLSAEEKRIRAVTSTDVNEVISFINIASRNKKNFSFKRRNIFEDRIDPVLHGKIKFVDGDGQVQIEDIYCYQPRLYGKGGVLLGPRTTANGSIVANGTYACSDVSGTYTGYVPKREIASNMQMDFDIKSPHSFVERFPEQAKLDNDKVLDNRKIQKFIQVDFDRDANGNYKVVDLNKAEERQKLEAYIEKHARINSVEYYLQKIRTARVHLYKYLKATKPDYLPPVNIMTEDLMKVEKKKKADQDKMIETMCKLAQIQYDEARFGITPYGSQRNMPLHGPHGHGPRPDNMNPFSPAGSMPMPGPRR